MRVTSSLRLEGEIMASGEASTTASGGSGGSIQIHTYEMEGSGSVQDTTSNVQNRTLIIDNGQQQLAASQAEVSGWDTTSYKEDGGRTWIKRRHDGSTR
ncbi:hypothetical protein NP493_132g02117 [Ridgeia piscesae]|uniref:Uncharacterized protein n=1 Tax=Ridgeia piscesae TaxID=27915 RepID=A0AAD9P5B4_RIDPI|nr:hypothetical protein NP493_132g02117 [Ridgeia piscesae]